jgi:hypothetical protein
LYQRRSPSDGRTDADGQSFLFSSRRVYFQHCGDEGLKERMISRQQHRCWICDAFSIEKEKKKETSYWRQKYEN